MTMNFNSNKTSNISIFNPRTMLYNTTATSATTLTAIPTTSYVAPPPTCKLVDAEIILIVLACIITCIVFCFNGFILSNLTFMRCKRLKKSRGNYDILLWYLSMFDLLSSITMTARIYTEITSCSKSLSWPLGDIGCKIVLPLYDISINMSVCILIIISVDRCQTVMTPLIQTFNRKRIHGSVFLSVLVSFGVYFERFITAKVNRGICGHFLDNSLLNLSPLLVWVIRDSAFLVTFTITSICIQRTLRGGKEFPLISTKHHKQQSRSISKMLIFTQLVFSALVLPYDILSSISLGYVMFGRRIPGLELHVLALLSNYLYLLQMSNSLANCFIYAKIHRLVQIPTRNVSERVRNRNRSSGISLSSSITRRLSKEILFKKSKGCNNNGDERLDFV